MPNLYRIKVQNAQLQTFPDLSEYSDTLNQIRVLDLANNAIVQLPSYLAKFNIGYLDLANNALGSQDDLLASYLGLSNSHLPKLHLVKYSNQTNSFNQFNVEPNQNPYLNLSGNFLRSLPLLDINPTIQLDSSSSFTQNPTSQTTFYDGDTFAFLLNLASFNASELSSSA